MSDQFLGMAGIDPWVFIGLAIAALLTAFISAVSGIGWVDPSCHYGIHLSSSPINSIAHNYSTLRQCGHGCFSLALSDARDNRAIHVGLSDRGGDRR